MTFRLILLLVALFSLNLSAQSPYHIDWKRESIYLGIGAGTVSAGMYMYSKTKVLQEEDILLMDRAKVNAFDRGSTYNYSSVAAGHSDLLLYGSHLLPGFFALNKRMRKDFGSIAILYAETMLITHGFTDLGKSVFKRTRPFVLNDNVPMEKKLSKNARYSFFSGHTSVTTSNCFFTAKVFADFFPDSKLKPFVWGAAATIPAITGYLRVKAGKHYASDVMTGYAVGALVGFFVPHFHKIQKDKPLQIMPGAAGLSMVWKLN